MPDATWSAEETADYLAEQAADGEACEAAYLEFEREEAARIAAGLPREMNPDVPF